MTNQKLKNSIHSQGETATMIPYIDGPYFISDFTIKKFLDLLEIRQKAI